MQFFRPIGKTGWLEYVQFNGRRVSVMDMILTHGYFCQYDGNTADGWWVYLRKLDTIGIEISPYFAVQDGERLYQLKLAFARMYGAETKLTKGRSTW